MGTSRWEVWSPSISGFSETEGFLALTFLRSSTVVGAGESEELGEELMRLTASTIDGWSRGKR